MRKPLTKADMMENALREIAASAAAKGGEWASEQAFAMLEFIDEPPQPVDDGGCDPLYGQRMDSADLGEC